jgi:hypothetical protein
MKRWTKPHETSGETPSTPHEIPQNISPQAVLESGSLQIHGR